MGADRASGSVDASNMWSTPPTRRSKHLGAEENAGLACSCAARAATTTEPSPHAVGRLRQTRSSTTGGRLHTHNTRPSAGNVKGTRPSLGSGPRGGVIPHCALRPSRAYAKAILYERNLDVLYLLPIGVQVSANVRTLQTGSCSVVSIDLLT